MKPESTGTSFIARKGMTEWGGTTGGAAHIPGGAMSRGFWSVNLRWGRILSDVRGAGPLRGNLEYAVEVVPAVLLRQPTTVFGAGVNPVLFQYNFTAGGRIVPFLQAGGGTLFTTQMVPNRTSNFNFTPQGGIGVYVFRQHSRALALGLRYHHISNAGIKVRNPGLNSLYFYTGFSWWH